MSDPTDPNRVAPLQVKDVVYERLRAALIDLKFRPGEPLREAALVKLFGVSKTPIREALVRLERDGLVQIAPYRGARARTYTAEDLRQLYEAREVLAAECVRRAALAEGPGTGEALTAAAAAGAAALEAGDPDALAARLAEFDELLLDHLRGNPMLVDVVGRLQAHFKRIGAGPQPPGITVGRYREVAAAVAAHDALAAQALVRGHLADALEAQLDALTGPASPG